MKIKEFELYRYTMKIMNNDMLVMENKKTKAQVGCCIKDLYNLTSYIKKRKSTNILTLQIVSVRKMLGERILRVEDFELMKSNDIDIILSCHANILKCNSEISMLKYGPRESIDDKLYLCECIPRSER